jgi:hypothetical protein
MTLLNAEPPKPQSALRKNLPVLAILVLVTSALLGYRLWDYSEERAVTRFLTALQEANYREAYRLWQPSPSYSFADFLHDWGEQGDYGKIARFQILRSKSKGSDTVIITVRINNQDPPLDLLVDRRTKGLAYSIF